MYHSVGKLNKKTNRLYTFINRRCCETYKMQQKVKKCAILNILDSCISDKKREKGDGRIKFVLSICNKMPEYDVITRSFLYLCR